MFLIEHALNTKRSAVRTEQGLGTQRALRFTLEIIKRRSILMIPQINRGTLLETRGKAVLVSKQEK